MGEMETILSSSVNLRARKEEERGTRVKDELDRERASPLKAKRDEEGKRPTDRLDDVVRLEAVEHRRLESSDGVLHDD